MVGRGRRRSRRWEDGRWIVEKGYRVRKRLGKRVEIRKIDGHKEGKGKRRCKRRNGKRKEHSKVETSRENKDNEREHV